MTMSVQQMIEVLQAYERGDRVQFKHVGQQQADWRDLATHNPSWNFVSTLYRIAKPEPRKIKMLCWLDADQMFWLRETALPKWPAVRVPAEDKEIEL